MMLALSSKTLYDSVCALPDWHVLLLKDAEERLAGKPIPILRGLRIIITRVRT